MGRTTSGRLLVALLALVGGVAGTVACGGSGSDAANEDADAGLGPSPGPGPGAYGDASAIPVFDFDAAGSAAPDAGPDADPIQPVDPGPSQGRVIWGVDEANHLLRFGTKSVAMVAIKNLTGLAAGDRVLAIDFRPATGALYAVSVQNRIYSIERATGAATQIGATPFAAGQIGQADGFDFNPVADRLRVHTDVDLNLRVHPDTGAIAATDGTLEFMAGDPNFGQSPNVVGTAYTNSVSPAPATTALYGIDSTRDLLLVAPNPNDGQLQTVGALGVDVTQVGGFDIWGNDANREAYAAFRVGDKTNLYAIDLATGAASLIEAIGFPNAIAGIAIEP